MVNTVVKMINETATEEEIFLLKYNLFDKLTLYGTPRYNRDDRDDRRRLPPIRVLDYNVKEIFYLDFDKTILLLNSREIGLDTEEKVSRQIKADIDRFCNEGSIKIGGGLYLNNDDKSLTDEEAIRFYDNNKNNHDFLNISRFIQQAALSPEVEKYIKDRLKLNVISTRNIKNLNKYYKVILNWPTNPFLKTEDYGFVVFNLAKEAETSVKDSENKYFYNLKNEVDFVNKKIEIGVELFDYIN
jgi:hypothetical protein